MMHPVIGTSSLDRMTETTEKSVLPQPSGEGWKIHLGLIIFHRIESTCRKAKEKKPFGSVQEASDAKVHALRFLSLVKFHISIFL